MFNSRRLSHLLDHGNRVSGREVRNASNVHMIIAGMSQVATPQVVSMEIAPNYQPHPTNVDV